ncbi:MAG TPA: PAS domain-containing protein [Blattabacteriaceae bacterium]|nr:PAS domain-containing protein [Blattabacteriaceae bacterium]
MLMPGGVSNRLGEDRVHAASPLAFCGFAAEKNLMRAATGLAGKLNPSSWPFIAATLLAVQAAALISKERELRLGCSSAVLLVILVVGTSIAAQNAVRGRHSVRLFWSLIAVALGLWGVNALLGTLYAIGLGRSLPELTLSAPIMFLHTIVMLAAMAAHPQVKRLDRRRYPANQNFVFLLLFWIFLYVFLLVPGQYLNWNQRLIEWFSTLYFIENIALAVAAATLALRARSMWKVVYSSFFGASLLYACSSMAANLKVAEGVYFTGFFDLVTTGAACVFVWAVICGRELAPQLAHSALVQRAKRRYSMTVAVLTVTAMPLLGLWELVQLERIDNVHTVRLFVVLVAGLLLTMIAFAREYFQQRRYAFDIDLARDQLHLAMQSSKSFGWDVDISTRQGDWFGDLRTFFGILSTIYTGPLRQFYRSIHPADRQQLVKTILKAAENGRPYTAVFRLVLPGKDERWMTSRGRFYYMASGKPSRMLGIAVDINEQKQAEESLRESEDKLRLVLESAPGGIYGTDLQGHCTFCNPATLSILGYKCAEDLLGQNVHQLIHHTHPGGTPYPRSECAVVGTLQRGTGVHSADEVYWKADGTPFPIEYWSLPQKKDGRIVGAVTQFIDITERQRAEDALRESESRFRNMANAAPMLLWVSGKDGVREYFNQSWFDFTGQDQSADGWIKCIHPADRENYLQSYTESFAARQSFHAEYRLRQRDGEYRRILESSVPRFTSSNLFEGYIGCGVDVTDVRRAEKEIALVNERLRLALEAGKAEVWDPEINTGKSMKLESHEALFGPSAGPHILEGSWDRVHSDDLAGLRQSMEIAQRERTGFSQDFRVVCLDGTIRWLHSAGKFMYSPGGEVERMLGITVDITERKRDVEALEKSQQQFSLAFEAARLGWWVWNQETGYVTLSEATKAILGLSCGPEITVDRFLDSVHPEDRERVYRKWWQSFDENAHYLVEYRVLRTDGIMQWVETRGRAYSDRKAVQIVGVTIDTTERRRAEEALRALGGRLIKAQEEERIRISRELHDDISQRLALLGVELERLSDSPVATNSGLQQAIEHLAQFTVEIGSSVQALSHELHSSKLEILGITAAMRGLCAEFVRQHNIKIEFNSNVSQRLLHDVSLCLYRILQEGLHNAVKHSGAKEFFVQLHAELAAVELTIRDHGVGFNVEEVMAERGLGLISMRERTKLVSGTLSIESAPSLGTTVRAKVPFKEEDQSAAA